MPNILNAAIDKIAEGALDTQCHNAALGFVKEGLLDQSDVPAMTKGLKLIIQVVIGTVAKGQS